MKTLASLLSVLQAQGTISPEEVALVASRLHVAPAPPSPPLLVSGLMGCGAWVSALFFVAFLAMIHLVGEGGTSNIAVGGVLIGCAVAAYRSPGATLFLRQLGLALSVAGHLILNAGACLLLDTHYAPALVMPLAAAALYPLVRDSLHRFLMVLAAVESVVVCLLWHGTSESLHAITLIEVVGILAAFLPARVSSAFRPAGYALACSLVINVLLVGIPTMLKIHAWPSTVILTVALVVACRWAAAGAGPSVQQRVAVAVIALGLLSTPGILAALLLLVIGFGSGRRGLDALAMAFLPVFLVLFYYNLEVDLAYKSWILMGSGVVLLAVRHMLGGLLGLAPPRAAEGGTP